MRQETEWLDLIPMSIDDQDAFHNTNIDSFVRRYLWDNEVISSDVSLSILTRGERCFKEENWGLWKIIVKESGAYIGYVGLWKFFDEPQPQLLYAIFEEYTGSGYASEAARKVVAYAFETLEYEFLVASMNDENIDSIKLCKRLGFSFMEEKEIDGELTYFYRIDNAGKA